MTGPGGRQLSTLLHALGAGRRAVPPVLPPTAGRVGAVQHVVAQFGAARPVQADPTTCGSAALVVLAAAGDPRLARWLATGEVEGGEPVPELGWLDEARRDVAVIETATATPTARFAALQQAVKVRSNRRALLGLPWPSGLGTPPWGAARVARFGTVRYEHRLLVDTSPGQSGPLLDHAVAAARRGIPVPLFTGGDTRGGLSAAVPRHVVVLTSPDGVALEIYEPSAGRMMPVTGDELARGGTRRPAYGNWSHVTWVLLPVARP